MRKIFSLLVMALLLQVKAGAEEIKKRPIVVAMCQSMQGNGYNWASTLSWLSETLYIRSTEARELEEKTGRKVLFYINCAGGGSSGAATTMLLNFLLENVKIVKPNNDLYTHRDLLKLSRALKYLGYNADLTKYEFSHFPTLFPAYSPHKSWWKGHYEDSMLINTFGRRAFLANLIDNSTVNSAIIEKRDEITFKLIDDIPSSGPLSGHCSDLLNREADASLSSGRNLLGGLGNQNSLKEVDLKFNKMLENIELKDGFMSAAVGYVVEEDSYNDVRDNHVLKGTPPFKRLRPVFFMNENTLNTIIGSKFYQNAVLNPKDKITRSIVLVAVDSLKGMVYPSIREPYANKLQYKLLASYGNGRYFDPLKAISHQKEFGLRRVKFDSTLIGGKDLSQYMINTGGWGNVFSTSRILGFYLKEILSSGNPSSLVRKHKDADFLGLINIFGKNATESSFNLYVINEFFSKNDDLSPTGYADRDSEITHLQGHRLRRDTLKNLALYYSHSIDFENSFIKRLNSNSDTLIDMTFVGVNWDKKEFNILFGLAQVPAAMVGKSRELVTMTVNLTRARYNDDTLGFSGYSSIPDIMSSDVSSDDNYSSIGFEYDLYHDRNYYYKPDWPKWLTDRVYKVGILAN